MLDHTRRDLFISQWYLVLYYFFPTMVAIKNGFLIVLMSVMRLGFIIVSFGVDNVSNRITF